MSGMNLKAAAVNAGVSGVALAERFDVSPQTISKWLNRRSPIPPKRRKEFAMAIGVQIDDLMPEGHEKQKLKPAAQGHENKQQRHRKV
jgi:transcriptional regulator with XRE-family HTH domain